ncbi:MAG: hypothetical protein ACKOFI_05160, partial [Phycisphaerales bacterium]
MIHALRRLPGQRKAFLALLSVIALAAGAAAAMRRAPAWWQPTARDAPGALVVARAREQGIASETTRGRGPGAQPWSVRVRAADVNAWLGARLHAVRPRQAAVMLEPLRQAGAEPRVHVRRAHAHAPG